MSQQTFTGLMQEAIPVSTPIVPQNKHTEIEQLPDEILVHIFSFLRAANLHFTVGKVCNRWRTIAYSPALWKTIEIGKREPLHVVTKWLERYKYSLKGFSAEDRNDINTLLPQVS